MDKKRKEFNKAAIKLTEKALELHRDDFCVFVRFAGHIDNIEVEWHNGGWKSGIGGDGSTGICFDSDFEFDDVNRCLDRLQEASDNNDILQKEAEEKRIEAEKLQLKKLQEKYGE